MKQAKQSSNAVFYLRTMTERHITAPHVEKSVCGIKYTKTVDTKTRQASCWRSPDNKTIYLGGWNNSCITALHDEGQEGVYKISGESTVRSGVSITDRKSLICIDGTSVITVNIKPSTLAGSELKAVNTLDVTNPRFIFHITRLKYGILCWKPVRIEFFEFRNNSLDQNPSQKRSIELDLPHASPFDTVCAAPDDTVCVAARYGGVIYRYNDKGVRLDVIGTGRGKTDTVLPGHLYYPVAIQRCGDSVLVTCLQGDVHTYLDGEWRSLMTNGNSGGDTSLEQSKKIESSVCSGTKFWAIDRDDDTKVHVYGILQIQEFGGP